MNFAHLEKYSENNRIEAKRATGGFPESVWETYSAFANTLGGIILLGVEEKKDYSLRAVNLPHPEETAEEFWRLVNDKRTVSANILKREQVAVEEVDGKKIVVVTVPPARQKEKPVFVGSTPFGGSYKRNGEGDYKCSKAEVEEMLRARTEPKEQNLTKETFGRAWVVGYLTEHAFASREELSAQVADWAVVQALLDEGVIVQKGKGYKLKR